MTAVFGSWKVPTVTGQSWSASNSSVWVGIDGCTFGDTVGGTVETTVEQIGTAQNVIGYPGPPTEYYAWYEMYSTGAKQPEQVITSVPGMKTCTELRLLVMLDTVP